MKPPFVRSPYNYDRDAASDESGLKCEDRSLARQEFREECDINTIVARFGLSGELPSGVVAPQYGDFRSIGSYHDAMNAVARANEAFDAMPAEVRSRFQNDPGQFVDFVGNPENRLEAEKMGLVVPRPQVEPAAAAPGSDAPA